MKQWELELDEQCRRSRRVLLLLLAVVNEVIVIGFVAFWVSYQKHKVNSARTVFAPTPPKTPLVPAAMPAEPILEEVRWRLIANASRPAIRPAQQESASWGGYYRPNCERIEKRLPDGGWSVSYVLRLPDGLGHRNRVDRPPSVPYLLPAFLGRPQ